ncbi:MAG: type I methionyl aminopeptidase [Phycisphaerales bacterium]|nr:type I methionyl aminopeptidase [Phycisphaerales bacterium]
MISQTPKIVLKSPREIELMRAAGRIVSGVLDEIESRIRPGVTTAELNDIAGRRIREAGGTALFLGVRHPQARFPFPASICSSVNEEVVHGIPDDRPLKGGDIVSVDVGVRLNGYCGDAARTFAIGAVGPRVKRLLDVTRSALDLAIEEARAGVRWSKIARQMQKLVEDASFGVVREFVGHGVGREMHEEPKVPNYVERGRDAQDFILMPGMTIAVEPMVTEGRPEVVFRDSDGWTIVTKDRSLAAHFEHTLAIREDGVDILTLSA